MSDFETQHEEKSKMGTKTFYGRIVEPPDDSLSSKPFFQIEKRRVAVNGEFTREGSIGVQCRPDQLRDFADKLHQLADEWENN
jgi:hypothetical protein